MEVDTHTVVTPPRGPTPTGEKTASYADLAAVAAALEDEGRVEEASSLYERGVRLATCGENSGEAADALEALARVARRRGELETAASLLERAVEAREQSTEADTDGQHEHQVARACHELADALSELSRFEEAEKWYERAIDGFEGLASSDREQENLALSTHNLAMALKAQGEYHEAKILCDRAVAIWEKAAKTAVEGENAAALRPSESCLNSEPRATATRRRTKPQQQQQSVEQTKLVLATALTNRASISLAAGDYDEARPLYERAVRIEESALGPHHPQLASDLAHLANLSMERGRADVAEPLLRRVVQIRQAHKDDRFRLAEALGALADLLQDQNRLDEARAVYQRAIVEAQSSESTKSRSPSSSSFEEDTESSSSFEEEDSVSEEGDSSASSSSSSSHGVAARTRHEGGTQIDENNQRALATLLNNLASLFVKQNRHDDALPLYERAVLLYETGRAERATVATALNNLGNAFWHRQEDTLTQKPTQAEACYRRALCLFETALGDAHPNVASALNNLAAVLSARGAFGEAETCARRGLEIRERALGARHERTAQSHSVLGWIHSDAGFFPKADAAHNEALRIAALSSCAAGEEQDDDQHPYTYAHQRDGDEAKDVTRTAMVSEATRQRVHVGALVHEARRLRKAGDVVASRRKAWDALLLAERAHRPKREILVARALVEQGRRDDDITTHPPRRLLL